MLKNRFGVKISPKTLRNWKSDKKNQLAKYSISKDYIQKVIAWGLSRDLRDKDASGDMDKDEPRDVSKDGDEEEVPTKPSEGLSFNAIGDIISYMNGKGYLVGSSQNSVTNSRGSSMLRTAKSTLRGGGGERQPRRASRCWRRGVTRTWKR